MPRGEFAPSNAGTGIGKHCGGLNVTEEFVMDEEQASWFVGVNGASQTHHVVLIDAWGRKAIDRSLLAPGRAAGSCLAESFGMRSCNGPSRVSSEWFRQPLRDAAFRLAALVSPCSNKCLRNRRGMRLGCGANARLPRSFFPWPLASAPMRLYPAVYGEVAEWSKALPC